MPANAGDDADVPPAYENDTTPEFDVQGELFEHRI
jgi:hypothetical protein